MESQDFIKILGNKFNVLVKDRDTYKFTTAGALFLQRILINLME